MNRKAFTLVELIIGMMITLIIMGATVAAGRIVFNVYQKSEANARVTNALRLTVEAYGREMMPLVNHANEIEILADNGKLPSKLKTSEDHYLYLSGDSLIHWSSKKREALGGSEYITSLDFNLKVNSEDEFENYMLSMDIAAGHPQYTAAKAEVFIRNALYNRTGLKKGGNSSNGVYYSGKVLHLVVDDTIIIPTLHVTKDDANGKNLDEETVRKPIILYASYDLNLSPRFSSDNYEDVSDITWYIATVKASVPEEHLSTSDPDEVDEKYLNTHCWQITTKNNANKPLTGRTFEISDKSGVGNEINVISSKNGKPDTKIWGEAGFTRYLLKPKIKDKTTGEVIDGDPVYSPWVLLTTKNSLWNLWATVNDLDNKGEGFFNNTDTKKFDVTVSRKDGETTAILQGKTNDVSTASLVLARLDAKYLKEQQEETIEDGKSYTTLTNYSIIVDTDINDADGIALLINGGGSYDIPAKPEIGDTGLMFQVAVKTDTLPMRLFADGKQHTQSEIRSWGTGDHGKDKKTITYTTDKYAYRFTGNGKSSVSSDHYGPFYGPGYMKNKKMTYKNDYYGDNNTGTPLHIVTMGGKTYIQTGPPYKPYNSGEESPYNGRTRFMITVLEYYKGDKKSPHFIIRVKFLKLENEGAEIGKNNDDWKIGTGWFNSEPAWYGDFIGETPTAVRDKNGKITEFKFTIRNNSSHNGEIFALSADNKGIKSVKPLSEDSFYITRINKGAQDKQNADDIITTLFEPGNINLREEISETSFNGLKDDRKTEILPKLFDNPNRTRYLGLRIWSNNEKVSSYDVKVYNIDLAPGFSKKELQAIMPEGSKMYEMSDTGETANLDGSKQKNLNKGLFGATEHSNGDGNESGVTNGVMGIQHVGGRNCQCPMCERYGKEKN